jgi:thermitase
MHPEPPDPTPSPWLSLLLSIGIAVMIAIGGWWLLAGIGEGETSAAVPKPARPAATQPGSSAPRPAAGKPFAQITPSELGSPPTSSTSLVATAPPPAYDALSKSIHETLTHPSAVPGEAVLTFASKAALARFLQRARSYGLEIISSLDGLNSARVRYSRESSLRDLLADPTADKPTLEANLWMAVPRLPKEDTANQGGAIAYDDAMLRSIGASADRSTWGKGITIAVLDTGIETHPTFGKEQVMHGHGTSVASLIAGTDERVPGISPGAHLLDIRVANNKGLSVSTVLAQGIIEAMSRGAQVINISMGSYGDSPLLRSAVQQATQRGILIVAAAGNEKYDQLAIPAAYAEVISVASVDKDWRQAYFSNSGTGLDIAAPGVGLTTAWGSNMAARVSGTSQSTGIISGAIAAYLSQGIRPNDVLRRLQADAKATGAPPNQVGSGVVFLRSLW